MIPTTVSAKSKTGAGTETQMNFGDDVTPDWRVIPGLLSSGEWGVDQEFTDDTVIADLDHTFSAGDRKAKEILLSMNHQPGNTDQKSFLDKAEANEYVQLKKVYSTGFTQTGEFLLAAPYYSDPTRTENNKVSVKAVPNGSLINGTVA